MKKLSLSLCVALLAIATSTAHAGPNLLTAGDFEGLSLGSRSSTGFNFPIGTDGQWRVDGYSIVGAQAGLNPRSGSQMLRFTTGGSNDTYQYVDVSGMSSAIDAGTVTADVSAFYNAFGVNDVTLQLRAYSAQPTSGFLGNTFLPGAFYDGSARTDADIATWDLFQLLDVVVPVGTRFLMVGIHSDRDFTSYADDVSLTLTDTSINVPAPGALGLLGLGLIGLGAARRK